MIPGKGVKAMFEIRGAVSTAVCYAKVVEEEAVEHYLKACKMTPSYIHRGNLDPEISELIKRYNLTNNYLQTH